MENFRRPPPATSGSAGTEQKCSAGAGINSVAHSAKHSWGTGTALAGGCSEALDFSQFHTVRMDWSPDLLEFFVDGERTWHLDRDAGATNYDWPYAKPHFALLNLAIGGNGVAGARPPEDAYPITYTIDYFSIEALPQPPPAPPMPPQPAPAPQLPPPPPELLCCSECATHGGVACPQDGRPYRDVWGADRLSEGDATGLQNGACGAQVVWSNDNTAPYTREAACEFVAKGQASTSTVCAACWLPVTSDPQPPPELLVSASAYVSPAAHGLSTVAVATAAVMEAAAVAVATLAAETGAARAAADGAAADWAAAGAVAAMGAVRSSSPGPHLPHLPHWPAMMAAHRHAVMASLPAKLPGPPPYYRDLLHAGGQVARPPRTLVFSSPTGEYSINGRSYNVSRDDFVLKLGAVVEWRLVSAEERKP